MDIAIKKVRIRNYRSLRNIGLELDDYIVLVGKNDSGKSNIMKAVSLAFDYSDIPEEDIYNSPDEPDRDDRTASIDIMLIPLDDTGKPARSFDDRWSAEFGRNIRTSRTGNEYFAFRTVLACDGESKHYKNTKYVIDKWSDSSEPGIGRQLTLHELKCIDKVYMDAERQISSNTEGQRHPAAVIPAAADNSGFGARSIAMISDIKTQRQNKSDKYPYPLPYHLLTLVEEPEAHVHPQAQRQLFSDIMDMDGQKIVTTHSPYILSQVELDKIRYVRKESSYTECYPLLVDDMSKDDIRKIKRTVMNTRGDILYANAVILAEGETEEQALPVFVKEYFGKEPFELGISIVGVGGSNYAPFIRILDRLDIRWYIFSDGEDIPVRLLKNCLKGLNLAKRAYNSSRLGGYPNVFILEEGLNFETYLLKKGYADEIIAAINKVERENGQGDGYFDQYIRKYHGKTGKTITTMVRCDKCGQPIREEIENDYLGEDGRMRALLDCMTAKGAKARYAAAIAEEICSNESGKPKVPDKIAELCRRIEIDSAGDMV